MAVVFVEIGQDVHVNGGSLNDAIHDRSTPSYRDGYLRKSGAASDNTDQYGDNTPQSFTTKIVPGDGLKITMAPRASDRKT